MVEMIERMPTGHLPRVRKSRLPYDGRILGPILTALGAFLIVVGALGRFYALPHLSVLPKDESQVITLTAPGATLFDVNTLKHITTDLTVKVRLVGNVDASHGNTLVWVQSSTITSADGIVRSQNTQSIPFNGNTGETVNCCPESSFDQVTATQRVTPTRSGHVFKLPFNPQKTSYMMWDDTLGQPVSAAYTGTDSLQGLKVYHFTTHVPATAVGTQDVPASLLGLPGTGNVKATNFYQNDTTYDIDPTTGVIVNQVSAEKTWAALGDHQLVTMQATISYAPDELATEVAQVKSKASKLAVAGGALPWIMMGGGAGLVIGGVLLRRRGVALRDR